MEFIIEWGVVPDCGGIGDTGADVGDVVGGVVGIGVADIVCVCNLLRHSGTIEYGMKLMITGLKHEGKQHELSYFERLS